MKEHFPRARVLGFDFVHRCQAFLIDLYFGMGEMKKWRQLTKMIFLTPFSYLMRPIAG